MVTKTKGRLGLQQYKTNILKCHQYLLSFNNNNFITRQAFNKINHNHCIIHYIT